MKLGAGGGNVCGGGALYEYGTCCGGVWVWGSTSGAGIYGLARLLMGVWRYGL